MAAGDLVSVADTVAICIVVDDDAVLTRLADAVHIGAAVVGIGGSSVVVAGGLVLATSNLIGIANPIVIGVVVDNQSVFAGLADAVDIRAGVVGVGGGRVVVAGGLVLTTGDLVSVANPVPIRVVVDDDAVLTGLADAVHVGAGVVGIGGSSIVVAGRLVLATGDLVSVTDAIAIRVVVHDDAIFTGLADAVDVSAGVVRVGCSSVVVAGRLVLAAGNLIGVTNPVVIGVVVDDDAVLAGLANAVDVGTGVVRIGRGRVVVAGGSVLATCNFIRIADPVAVGVIVDHRARAVGGARTRGATGCKLTGPVIEVGGGVKVASRRIDASWVGAGAIVVFCCIRVVGRGCVCAAPRAHRDGRHHAQICVDANGAVVLIDARCVEREAPNAHASIIAHNAGQTERLRVVKRQTGDGVGHPIDIVQ